MPNDFQGVNLDEIAEMTLDALGPELIPIMGFATDFSGNASAQWETITTRYPVRPTLKVMESGANRQPTDQQTISRSLTLGQIKGWSMKVTDREQMFSRIKLMDLFVNPGVEAIAEGLTGEILAKIIDPASNFARIQISEEAFAAKSVADLATALTTAKVRKKDRAGILVPGHFNSLVTDGNIQQVFASGNDEALREHNCGRVHGFNIFEYNGEVPDNFAGYFGHRQALIIAARQVYVPEAWYGQVVVKTEPITGLPLQFRYYYDAADVCQKLEVLALWGIGLGVVGNGVIVEAA